jgi:tetratricopeptide (TPR) repeat protein
VRDHLAHVSAQSWDDAIDAARHALAEARLAGDVILQEWINQSLCVALIHVGKAEEAESRLGSMIDEPDWDSNIAWSAATAYHLTGDLPRAVEWYRRVLHRPGDRINGRKMYEFLEGAIFALGEMGRWDDARKEVQLFRNRASTRPGENGGLYAGWVEWRSTGQPPDALISGEPDLTRYLELEYALLKDEDPQALMSRADQLRPLLSGKSVLIDSLRAECLLRMDRAADAYQLALEAWQRALTERRTDPLIRCHFDLVTERMIRSAEAAGKGDDAEEARRELARLRYRDRPQ